MPASVDFTSPTFEPEPIHYMIVQLNMLGHPIGEISSQVRKPVAYVRSCLKSDWATQLITTWHERFTAQLTAKTFEPVSAFYDKLEEKMQLLDGLTKSEDEKIALRAVELWISHTLGSPVKRTEVKTEGSILHYTTDELRFIKDHGRLPTQQERLTLNAPSIDAEFTVEPDPS